MNLIHNASVTATRNKVVVFSNGLLSKKLLLEFRINSRISPHSARATTRRQITLLRKEARKLVG